MTMIETIQEILSAHEVQKDYTTQEIETFILEAKLLVNAPFMNDTILEEYTKEFSGDVYVTDNYPIKQLCELTINGSNITPDKIEENGIIHLSKSYHGKLQIRYIVGLTTDDINNYLIPLVVAVIENKAGMNISSITEGDVSVSYNNNTGANSVTIDSIVNELREKYSAKVVVL